MEHAGLRYRRPDAEGCGGSKRPRDKDQGRELPGIAAALSDPLVRTMMRADRVDPSALEQQLRAMARRLAQRGRPTEGRRAE